MVRGARIVEGAQIEKCEEGMRRAHSPEFCLLNLSFMRLIAIADSSPFVVTGGSALQSNCAVFPFASKRINRARATTAWTCFCSIHLLKLTSTCVDRYSDNESTLGTSPSHRANARENCFTCSEMQVSAASNATQYCGARLATSRLVRWRRRMMWSRG